MASSAELQSVRPQPTLIISSGSSLDWKRGAAGWDVARATSAATGVVKETCARPTWRTAAPCRLAAVLQGVLSWLESARVFGARQNGSSRAVGGVDGAPKLRKGDLALQAQGGTAQPCATSGRDRRRAQSLCIRRSLVTTSTCRHISNSLETALIPIRSPRFSFVRARSVLGSM